MLVFLDTEFTNFHQPQLLSLGMVSLAGDECYAEIDVETMEGRLALVGASEFVRGPEVLGQWGKVSGAAMSAWAMGERAGQWLAGQADLHEASGAAHQLEICADYAGDFELLERVLRDANHWDRLRHRIRFHDISRMLARALPDIAAQECFADLAKRRGITQHHALADALGMRAGYMAVRELEARKGRR
jgi:hypothetical protein